MATRAPTSSGASSLPDDIVRRSAAFDEEEASFRALLTHVRTEVSLRLSRLLDEKVSEASKLGPDVEAMAKAVRDLTMRGGKRFRPALALAAYLAIDDAADEEPALEAGVVLELLQTYLLVHDDWMDRDEVRRGGPAVHVMLGRHFGSRDKGDASSILAGDWTSAIALEALAKLDLPGDRLAQAFTVFSRIQQDAICGQQLDLAGRPSSVEAMHDLKTGSYTVRGPLLLGSAIAGGSPTQRALLERFARPLGIAFQLRDDLLGAFGDPKETGKPSGSDIRAGKRTMLAASALERASRSDRDALARLLGKADATDDEVLEVVRIYQTSGAKAEVEGRLEALVSTAISELDGSRLQPRGRAYLVGSARALTTRRS